MSGADRRVRDDDRTMNILRRRDDLMRRRRKRQAPAAQPLLQRSEDKASSDDGFSSDDAGISMEDEDSKYRATQTRTVSRIAESEPTSFLSITTTSKIRSATSTSPPPSPTSTLSPNTSTSTSLTLALPIASAITLVTQSSIATQPRHQLSPSAFPTGTHLVAMNPSPTFDPTPEAINTETPPVRTRQHSSLSHGATVALEAVGIMVGISIFLGLAFLFYRRYRRRHSSSNGDENEKGNHSRSSTRLDWANWGKLWGRGRSDARNNINDADTSTEAERQQRLELVRVSLLNEKDLRGPSFLSKMSAPIKAVLRRDGEGRMTMTRSERGDNSFGNVPAIPRDRVQIEAGGLWDDPVTIARADGITPIMLPIQLPRKPIKDTNLNARGVLPERAPPNMEYVNNRLTMTTVSRELSHPEDVDFPPELGARAGVNSVYGSQKAWGDRARERESKFSITKWQDPVSWVRDQSERRKDGRVVMAGERGMERLPDDER